MADNVIRAFLVSLGWEVDTAGMNRFAGAIAVQTEAVRELGEGMKAAAAKVAGFVRDLASGLDALYFASVKTKASAANLEALRYAAEQTGVSFDAIRGNIQSLANFITYKPGGATWLHQLGVEAKDADGKARDTATVFQELAKAIAQRPAQNKGAYLQFLGIDPQVFEAVTSGKFDQFFREHQARAKAMGVNQNDDAGAGNDFLTQMRRIEDQIGLFEEGTLAPLLSRALPYIEKFVNSASAAIQKLIDWWDHLSDTSKTVIKWALAIAAGLAGLVIGLVALGSIVLTVSSAFAALAPVFTLVGGVIAALTSPIGLVIAAIGLLALAFKTDLKPILSDVWTLLKGIFSGDWGGANKQAQAIGSVVTRAWTKAADKAAPGGPGQGATRGLRNNNAGNIEYGRFAREHGATGVEAAGRFATFATAQDGLNAGAALLRSYAARGIDSVEAIISKYAPARGKDGKLENNTAAYIAYVAKRMGVGAGEHLNLNDPARLAEMERAIVQMESGPNPYSAEMYNRAAQQAIGGAGAHGATISQTITTTVTGAADPQGVSRAVSGAIDKSNGLLLRSFRNANS